jgi:tetratricopeptide (TPR) repeat protein/predicted Ser/Thr protein kinase
MMVPVRCPNPACAKASSIAAEHLGRVIRCPHCGETFAIAHARGGPPRPGETPVLPATGKETVAAPRPGPPRPTPPPARAPEALPGAPSCVGRFQIRARLGAGAFGTVFRAYDPQLDREVALKVPHPDRVANPRAVERFLREARAAAQLRHPHIVPVYEAGHDGGQYYLVTAFIDGHTLAESVARAAVSCRRAAQTVLHLAEALQHAHGLGIVHRDVKPANIMVDAAGEAYLMDFGLAYRREEPGRLTRVGAMLGTPSYMAPEQAQGQSAEVHPASDQYSLGVVLYELLCGETPFQGPPEIVLFNVLHQEPPRPRQVNPAIPPELEAICLKATARRPEERYASCQAFAATLRSWLEEKPVPAGRPGGETAVRTAKPPPAAPVAGRKEQPPSQAPSPRRPRQRRRGPLLAAGAAGVVVVTLALTGGVMLHSIGRVPPPEPRQPAKEGPKDRKGVLPGRPVTDQQDRQKPPEEPKADGGADPGKNVLGEWGTSMDPDGDCSFRMEGGALTIRVPGTAHDLSTELNRLNGPRTLRDVTGDFSAEVKISSAGRPGARGTVPGRLPYTAAGLLLWQDRDNYFRLEQAAVRRDGTVEAYAAFELRQDGQRKAPETFRPLGEAVALRLERRGNQVFGAVAQGGGPWLPYPPFQVTFPAQLHLGVAAVNTSTEPFQARFEDFRITSPVPAAGAAKPGAAVPDGPRADAQPAKPPVPAAPGPATKGATANNPAARAALQRGEALARSKELDAAIAAAAEAIGLDPQFSPAYLFRASMWTAKQQFDKVLSDCDQVLRLDSRSDVAYTMRAYAAFNLGNSEQTVRDSTEAIRLNPKNIDAYGNRTSAYIKLGQLEKAIADSDAILRQAPRDVPALARRAWARSLLGRYDMAILDFDEALKIQPENAGLWDGRANARFSKKDLDGAVADSTRAINLDPKVALFWQRRGNAYLSKPDYRHALDDYTEALRLDPKNAPAWNGRGVASFRMGQYAQAVEDCTRAIELNPKFAEAFLNRSVALQTLDRKQEADADLQKYRELTKK